MTTLENFCPFAAGLEGSGMGRTYSMKPGDGIVRYQRASAV